MLLLGATATVITTTSLTSSTQSSTSSSPLMVAEAKLADRSRVVKARYDSGRTDRYHDNGRPIEGQSYRSTKFEELDEIYIDTTTKTTNIETSSAFKAHDKKQRRKEQMEKVQQRHQQQQQQQTDASMEYVERRSQGDVPMFIRGNAQQQQQQEEADQQDKRKLSSQLTGCCYNYQNYYAADLCALYGHDCESGETPSHDSGDESCQQDGLSFIGISFSVNTANGNPYSYQLCDQFPMEHIIDRDYDYVMSMDEDGWLVGGGYKTFDYSGKMP
jgi:hypothetical protein